MNKFKQFELGIEAQKEVSGGVTTMELIQLFWDLTPDGTNSTWTNEGDGVWSGYYWNF